MRRVIRDLSARENVDPIVLIEIDVVFTKWPLYGSCFECYCRSVGVKM